MRSSELSGLALLALAASALFFSFQCGPDIALPPDDFYRPVKEWDYLVVCHNGQFQAYKIENFGGGVASSQPIASPINGRRCDSISTEDAKRAYTASQAVELGIIAASNGGKPGSQRFTAPLERGYRLLADLPFGPFLSRTDAAAAQSLACNPNGAVYFVDHSGGLVLRVNTCPLQLAREINVGSNPLQLALTPDGSQLLVTRYDGSIVVIDTSSDQIVKTIPTPALFPSGIAPTPDGRQAWFTSYFDGDGARIALLDIASGSIVRSIVTSDFPRSIVLTPDGAQAWVNFYNSSQVSVYDTLSGDLITTFNMRNRANTGIAFSPTGTRAYIAIQPNQLGVYDTATMSEIKLIPVVNEPINVLVSIDGSAVIVNGGAQAGITFIDANTNSVIGTVSTLGPSQGMAIYQ